MRTAGVVAALVVPAAHGAVVGSPSQAAVNAANSVGFLTFSRGITNGAFTNGSKSGGAPVVLAVASYAGNTTADARLLAQIRASITGGSEIIANGGYVTQHERHITGMFAIVKQTPRIWNQLTTAEKTRIDLVMKASLVACAFTTCNTSPYILAFIASGGKTAQRTLDGDSNLGRDWNPNYKEGMIGGMLVAMAYFGGPDAANAILNNYNHAQFLSELRANGLTNLAATFNWKAANPTVEAPTGAMIESGIKNYKYYSSGLADYMGIYTSLVNDTYGAAVTPGLNNGAGVWASNVGGYAGMLISGAATLPNRGAVGMLKEFASSDGNGPRSSLEYAYDGYRPHQTNQLVLIICGFWKKRSAATESAVARMKIGNTDLWYKLQKGYYDYAKGGFTGITNDLTAYTATRGFTYVRSLWEDVLLPYHNSSVEPEPDPEQDTDSDGTTDVIERRLGLDPANPASRFTARLVSSSSIEWPSSAGLTFVVQRSVGTAELKWETIATVTGSAGVSSFSDPSPPEGSAFYRVGLNP